MHLCRTYINDLLSHKKFQARLFFRIIHIFYIFNNTIASSIGKMGDMGNTLSFANIG